MNKYFVLCQINTSNIYKTLIPVKARDVQQAIKHARSMGLIPFEVLRGK